MVQKELQQRQVVGAQLPTQNEVATQTAVEVLGDAAGPYHLPRHLGHGYAQGVLAPAQLPPQDRVPLPATRTLLGPRCTQSSSRTSPSGTWACAARVAS